MYICIYVYITSSLSLSSLSSVRMVFSRCTASSERRPASAARVWSRSDARTDSSDASRSSSAEANHIIWTIISGTYIDCTRDALAYIDTCTYLPRSCFGYHLRHYYHPYYPDCPDSGSYS